MIKPILFNSLMVRAILGGRKTITRRVVNPQPVYDGRSKNWEFNARGQAGYVPINKAIEFAPYAVGDVLWVRETWREWNESDADCGCGGDYCLCNPTPPTPVCYRADGHYIDPEDRETYGLKWRPSIHMPKWACRLWLRVTDVRVERLQDIGDEDAVAEGCLTNDEAAYELSGDPGSWPCPDCGGDGVHGALDEASLGFYEVDCTTCDTPRKRFICLWDSLTKPGTSWDDNPWVWVIQFERCEKPEGWAHA
jgi:hypothetical protein